MTTQSKRRQSLPPFDWAGFERAGYAGPREFPKVWGYLMDESALFSTYLAMGGHVDEWYHADPLELVLGAGDFFRTRLLVEHGRDFSALQNHAWGKNGHLPLWFLLFSRWSKEDSDERMALFEFLVGKGLDVNQKSSTGHSVAFSMILANDQDSLIRTAQLLSQAGLDWNQPGPETGQTAGWAMAQRSAPHSLDYRPLIGGAYVDPFIQDNQGRTLLWEAAWWGNFHLFSFLLDIGSDPHLPDREDQTLAAMLDAATSEDSSGPTRSARGKVKDELERRLAIMAEQRHLTEKLRMPDDEARNNNPHDNPGAILLPRNIRRI